MNNSQISFAIIVLDTDKNTRHSNRKYLPEWRVNKRSILSCQILENLRCCITGVFIHKCEMQYKIN